MISSNEQALINLLGEYMVNVDITVQHAEGDSDYKICSLPTVACRSAQAGVIADYTDIFQSSLAIMLRVVSDIVYRRLKLSLQYVFKKLKISLMMNVFNNQTYFSILTQKKKHWHGLDHAVNVYCQ